VRTTVTLPMSIPWVTAPSALSAKNSMNATITPVIVNSTIHSGTGMIPSAPCTRSTRACSRCEVWSIQRSYADCSVTETGSTAATVRNISTPHGLTPAPSVPSAIAGHSAPTTERA